MAYVGQNGLWLSRSIDTRPLVTNGSYLEAVASGDVYLASLASDVNIDGGAVLVRTGNVFVRDGGVTLASREVAGDVTAAVCHGAGLTVGAGESAALSTERSIKWARGFAALPSSEAAATAMAGSRSNVGSWDVRGGGLRLVAKSSSHEIAYGLYVNPDHEMELYWREIRLSNSNTTYRRVIRFGNSLNSNSVQMLPTSPVL